MLYYLSVKYPCLPPPSGCKWGKNRSIHNFLFYIIAYLYLFGNFFDRIVEPGICALDFVKQAKPQTDQEVSVDSGTIAGEYAMMLDNRMSRKSKEIFCTQEHLLFD